MNPQPEKILVIQFKYFGDAVLLTPALRALHQSFPQSEIHLLAPAEIAPLFAGLPALHRVWAMPRRRGKSALGQSLPFILALRRERFDRVVDFGGNDRGAILSLVTGGRNRLGWARPGRRFGCHLFYHRQVVSPQPAPHESVRLAQLLAGWEVPAPASWEPEIQAEDALADAAQTILPAKGAILFHLASGNRKKEWPVPYWAELYRLARSAGLKVYFTTPVGSREAALLAATLKLIPDAAVLAAVPSMPLFLAVLKRAGLFVSGDTGPLHFAAGLGVPTLSLFGPTSPKLWAPAGSVHRFLTAGACTCPKTIPACARSNHCLAEIHPTQVMAALNDMLARRTV